MLLNLKFLGQVGINPQYTINQHILHQGRHLVAPHNTLFLKMHCFFQFNLPKFDTIWRSPYDLFRRSFESLSRFVPKYRLLKIWEVGQSNASPCAGAVQTICTQCKIHEPRNTAQHKLHGKLCGRIVWAGHGCLLWDCIWVPAAVGYNCARRPEPEDQGSLQGGVLLADCEQPWTLGQSHLYISWERGKNYDIIQTLWHVTAHACTDYSIHRLLCEHLDNTLEHCWIYSRTTHFAVLLKIGFQPPCQILSIEHEGLFV